jgi:hypothetical protein
MAKGSEGIGSPEEPGHGFAGGRREVEQETPVEEAV